jgi:putative spermidine/putrescine transport system ATP-binding protein
MASVTLTSIAKHYGNVQAIENFSLEVTDGEFLVLLGPSGCGKSTTLRVVAGFIEATTGSVHIGERDVTYEPPYRRNIGLVFQNYALFPHLTVFENVAFGLRRRGVAEEAIAVRVREALAMVKLEHLADRLPRQMSGGQQQRVAIARAIAIEPDILLLDEPLSNLDAKLRVDVRHELKRLQREVGITTIMVTHDQDEAMSVADRLVVMNHGSIQQVGDAETLYRRPANRFVASFIGQANFLPGRRIGDSAFLTDGGLHFDCAEFAPDSSLLMIRPEGIRLDTKPFAGVPNAFEAAVDDIVFLGATREIYLTLPDGSKLQARSQQGDPDSPDLRPGRTAHLAVHPENAVGIHDT